MLTAFKRIVSFSVFLVISCSSPIHKKEIVLYNTYCSSCHIAPSVSDLPKEIWEKEILPEMGARMGIRDDGYNPLKGLSFREMGAINQTGVYPYKSIISKQDWDLLKNYIINMAPDSLTGTSITTNEGMHSQFTPVPVSLDGTKGSLITFLEYDKEQQRILTGNISGSLFQYNFIEKEVSPIAQFGNTLIAYTEKNEVAYGTTIGQLDPSDQPLGKVITVQGNTFNIIPEVLHRPVHTLVHDLNQDGNDELVISEFGNLTGKLSLLIKNDSIQYQKKVLLNQPGTIRVLAKDMDKDGKEDLIALTSQGDESITILYQEDNLQFRADKVLRFSPVYGSSWFELIDYDGDGDEDIITVNGDNADKSYVQKPYHGMRIHINDGSNRFEEKYFYPLNGATRLVARDFDQDGDVDFGLLSTFPDYEHNPGLSFVYLENTNASDYDFNTHTFKESKLGRWFLMDAGDVDNDGDEDIILSSFTYVFTPVPKHLSELWNEKNTDIMVLENKLYNKAE